MPESFSSLLKDEVSASVVLGLPEKMAKSRGCGADSAAQTVPRGDENSFHDGFKIAAHKRLQSGRKLERKQSQKAFFN